MMNNKKNHIWVALLACCLWQTACNIPKHTIREPHKTMPQAFQNATDSTTVAALSWREYFSDPYLQQLIDTALQNNQELNILLSELTISRNEVRARKGEYLPFVGVGVGAGVDKKARYTNLGAMEATTEIKPGKEMPDPLTDMRLGLYATWELDIWRKLRNASQAAATRYLATAEGRNFVITELVAEIANSYYELVALDNELAIVNQNIEIQSNALRIVRIQKQASRTTELAVKRFEAEVARTTGLQYSIKQEMVEAENRINFLLGRYPQPVIRTNQLNALPTMVQVGVPSQLLANRPDIRQAELALEASKLDVKVARAQFYPQVGITASLGYQAFNPAYFLKTPESMLYSLAGDLMAPLVNRNAIIANYGNANAKQLQAVFDYEQTILSAYLEVLNQMANIDNLKSSIAIKSQQVEALTQSINISNDLFNAARADYMEVLLTQRDALESRFELVETQKMQLHALVNIYKALGGGWK